MINFGALAKSKSGAVPASNIELFDQLDRKASHQILRPVQSEALVVLDTHRDARDNVLKVSTGSGKTVIGLVYAEMMRHRYPGEAALYLCPTHQLIEQVLATAEKIGVAAQTFVDGEAFDGLGGQKVLVCTYDKLFTARNTFERQGIRLSALVMDDVHSGVERVKQKYTVKVPEAAYRAIRKIFDPLCRPSDPAVWRGIDNEDESARYEVPYWAWGPQTETVAGLMAQHPDDNEILFSWPNISRYLEQARLCITGTGAELSLSVPATEENRAFAAARHRLFMSASIKDGTSLLRDFDCDPAALDRVIEPPSDRGAGERMILPVALIDPKLKKADVGGLASAISAFVNVVVLTSSTGQANVWQGYGAKAVLDKDVDAAVEKLRATSKGNFVAFAQRFDGVDLPDEACRVLIIDGIPIGERVCDQIDSERQKDSPGFNARAVNRLEQALGRAVRSGADFAAVLLVGADLAAFVGRRDVQSLLEPHTREQISLGRDVAEQLKASGGNSLKAIGTAVQLLLARDNGWKDAHRERTSGVARVPRPAGLTVGERSAVAERKAWLCGKARNDQGAVALLREAIDIAGLHELQKAELMARSARYMNSFDAAQAANLYRGAFQINSLFPRPPHMPDRRYAKVREQSAAFSEALKDYSTAAAAVAALESIRSQLSFGGTPETVEQGLKRLGTLLGADAQRPEKETGRGPDGLWIFDDLALCIEAKSEKKAPIHKSDAEQLLLSREWCTDHTSIDEANTVPVFVTNVTTADRPEDISFRPKLLNEAALMEIVDDLSGLLNSVSFDGPLFRDVADINRRLAGARLTGAEIARRLKNF